MVSRVINGFLNRLCTWRCNIRDFRTSRHIFVIESDDWGSIRMSSREAWDSLKSMGYHVNERPYERYDILESNEDVNILADVLLRYKDIRGNHPVITMNYLSANPNFEAIKKNGLREYCHESIEDTYQKYPQNHHKVLTLVRQGMNEGVFKPQCHGREHFNVLAWMRALQTDDIDVHNAFLYNMCGIAPKNTPQFGNHFMVALESRSKTEQAYVCSAVKEGLESFESLWGYPSISFVAPCYTWNDKIESVLQKHHVQLIQTTRMQRRSDKLKNEFRFSGELNKFYQFYSIRNCYFEPATSQDPDNEVENCLMAIHKTFEKNKIAILSSHRINYVSGIDCRNRDRTLSALDNLLSKVISRYPDVEFMSSDQLVKVFEKD